MKWIFGKIWIYKKTKIINSKRVDQIQLRCHFEHNGVYQDRYFNKHCIFKWQWQGSLSYIFVLFKQLLDFNGIETNLYFRSREQARWPLELRHGPTNVIIYCCESSGGDWFSRGPPRVRSQQSKIIMSKWLIEQSQIWKELGKRRCDETKINLASFHQNFCLKILQRSASG